MNIQLQLASRNEIIITNLEDAKTKPRVFRTTEEMFQFLLFLLEGRIDSRQSRLHGKVSIERATSKPEQSSADILGKLDLKV